MARDSKSLSVPKSKKEPNKKKERDKYFQNQAKSMIRELLWTAVKIEQPICWPYYKLSR